MKKYFFEQGIINVFLFIPIWFLTTIWSMFIGVVLCIELLGFDTIPNFALIVGLLPLLSVPVSCISGIVRGVINRKEKGAILCVILSFIGLILFVFSLYGMMYLGANY